MALTFRNRAMLEVPDTRNSPLFRADEPELPPSAVFVPMLTHQEVLGVLMMTFRHHRQLGKDEQAAVQHVANQIATSLKLQEQKVMREQLLRSEKMAASGQLISGIATELRAGAARWRLSPSRCLFGCGLTPFLLSIAGSEGVPSRISGWSAKLRGCWGLRPPFNGCICSGAAL